MALYETVVIARQETRSEGVASLAKIYTEILEKNAAKVVRWESWGLRNLAFPIRKNTKAHYFMLCIDGAHSAIAEMESRLRYDDKVLRYMTVRVKVHGTEDSTMVPKRTSEGDERGARRSRTKPDEGEGEETKSVSVESASVESASVEETSAETPDAGAEESPATEPTPEKEQA